MEFCPKCGSLMLPKKTDEGLVLACSKCGHVSEAVKAEEYKLVKNVESKKKSAEIIEDQQVGLPTARVTCPNCGNDRAYWWMRQTRAGDEPSTRFYRCVKCNRVWREYA